MAPFTVAVFCDFGGVFAFREMPFDPLFEDDITPRINMLRSSLCARRTTGHAMFATSDRSARGI